MEKLHAQIEEEIAADADSELYSPAELATRKGRVGSAPTAGLKSPLLSGME
jgi:hypothetical protein